MMAITLAEDGRVIGLTALSLFLFGILYNFIVDWLGPRKTGYTSLWVVGGSPVTLAGVAIISWQAAAVSVGAFAASGLPMVIGEIWRSIQDRGWTS